jgi:hypothetical protein
MKVTLIGSVELAFEFGWLPKKVLDTNEKILADFSARTPRQKRGRAE